MARMDRRAFLGTVSAGLAGAALCAADAKGETVRERKQPNVVFVFADQWRAQATGYAGDPNVRTPHLDRLARRCINLTTAVSCCPVCSPYRASLMTGQYPLTHGIFLNDLYLQPESVSLAEAFAAAGYDTAYIGKWHLDGHGRSAYIPPERRQGFDFWRVLECTHDYNRSLYYADEPEPRTWEGYDAVAQTREAQRYLADHAQGKPFLLVLSWGPPHEPYHTAPEEYRALYDPKSIVLRPNVPEDQVEQARSELAGYYAHCSALDACVGDLLVTLRETGMLEDTIFVFTSDHGDMLHSQGRVKKQHPFDESILVPFLLSYPARFGREGREIAVPINAPDLMPTLLGLAGAPIPDTVEGKDYTPFLEGTAAAPDASALIACPSPFGQVSRDRGGREYRGVRTLRYTYVRDLDGPWLLFDNRADPYQQHNRIDDPQYAALQAFLEADLQRKLSETRDEFLPGPKYIERWGYTVDASGTVGYK